MFVLRKVGRREYRNQVVPQLDEVFSFYRKLVARSQQTDLTDHNFSHRIGREYCQETRDLLEKYIIIFCLLSSIS